MSSNKSQTKNPFELNIESVAVTGFSGSEKAEFELLLGKWIGLVNRYSELHSDTGDACYWYNERATISVFAAAAWQLDGWCALEEYSNEKQNKDGTSSSGRCDLYLLGNNASYACEAKQAWQPIGKRVKNPNKYLLKMLKNAANDAKSLSKGEADKRLALSFCVPSFPLSEIKNKGNQLDATTIILDWLKELDKVKVSSKVVACAYTFPSSAKVISPTNGNRIYPGVVLLISEVKRGHTRKSE